jgi:hypothetical protein
MVRRAARYADIVKRVFDVSKEEDRNSIRWHIEHKCAEDEVL